MLLYIPSGSQILFPSSSKEANWARSEEAATINEVEGSKRMLEYDRPRGTDREGKGPLSWKSGIHSNKLGPYEGSSTNVAKGFIALRLTSSEYSKKSPFESHNEHGVNACTTLCPDGYSCSPPLSLARIQLGLSPVKNTPEKVVPTAGVVTNGMNMRRTRFCSAIIPFSFSSVRCISNAFDSILTNLILRLDARGTAGGSSCWPAGSAS